MTTPLRAIDDAYTAAIHAARDEMMRAKSAIDATQRLHWDAAWATYQAAVTEAQRAHDAAVEDLNRRGAA